MYICHNQVVRTAACTHADAPAGIMFFLLGGVPPVGVVIKDMTWKELNLV